MTPGVSAETAAEPGDDAATLLALGILAYVAETVGHEAIGHGSVCLLTGGQVTAIAPLWMHCSVETPAMVLAGPLFNLAFGAACGVAVYLWPRTGALGLWLWLSCAFNLLVACGYLAVGGATGFGDWPYLLGGGQPAWLWRAAAVGIGLAGYVAALSGLRRLYVRIAGPAGQASRRLQARTLLPAAGAAVVACAAELANGRIDLGGLGLSLGCTLFVGWSLSRIGEPGGNADGPAAGAALAAPRRPLWIGAAALAAVSFILMIGRTAP
jgi:hypothetical protein